MMFHYFAAALLVVSLHFTEGAQWALLIAGSKGYENYRHQADVCHAYHVLRGNGIPESNIIVMMYDDIANNPNNPFPGTIINQPGGKNVYAGVRIDYTGNDVGRENFLNVLKGDKWKMQGIGSGRVIESRYDDNVFVYYSDHGGAGFIMFPNTDMLFAYNFNAAILEMNRNDQFKHLVFYIESCYSGSLFHETLPANINVYAVTAANNAEKSYACYYDNERHTFLADEFSAYWMSDSENSKHMDTRTLQQQYKFCRKRTKDSHVMNYGDVAEMGALAIGDFHGKVKLSYGGSTSSFVPITDAVPTFEVPYMLLKYKLDAANTTEARLDILQKMQEEVETRTFIREGIRKVAKKFVHNPNLLTRYAMTPATAKQSDCYEQVVVMYRDACIGSSKLEYALQDLRVFENLCIRGESTESIKAAIKDVC